MKLPRDGPVQILEDGLAPDEQADRRHHGGPEMAVHLYPLDHHSFWREQLGPLDLLDKPGAFGSNLAVAGIVESDVHIGDRFRVGTAVLEVNQPRKPCWKIEHRFAEFCDSKGMVETIVQTGRSGWYFRVVETGEVRSGDVFERIATGDKRWSVARVFYALMAGKAEREELAELSRLPSLAPELQKKAADKLRANALSQSSRG